MTKISPEHIDNTELLLEFLQCAMSTKPVEGHADNRAEVATQIIQNIVTHADGFLKDTADNIAIALRTVHSVLNRAVDVVSAADVGISPAFLDEVREVTASYDPSLRIG